MNEAYYRREAVAPSAAAESIPSPDGHSNLIDTDYVIGQDNITSGFFGLKIDLHSTVFTWSSLVILAFVTVTLAMPEAMEPFFGGIRN